VSRVRGGIRGFLEGFDRGSGGRIMGGGAYTYDVVRRGDRYSYTQDGQEREWGRVETGRLACFDLGYLILTILIGMGWAWL
jgi:hypothetical protein